MNSPLRSAVRPIQRSCLWGIRFHMAAKAGAPDRSAPPASRAWKRASSSDFETGQPNGFCTCGAGESLDSGTKSMAFRWSSRFMAVISLMHRGHELSHHTVSSFSVALALDAVPRAGTTVGCHTREICTPCLTKRLIAPYANRCVKVEYAPWMTRD